jgi:nitrite transporter NirC
LYSEEISKLSDAAIKKDKLFKKGKMKYVVSSALAGMYIGLAIIFIYTIGGMLYAAHSPAAKIVMGASFGVGLSLVLACGSDLFTGNTLIMPLGVLEKKVNWKSVWNICATSYIGNFIGSVIIAAIFVGSGLAQGDTAEFILKGAAGKMAPTFMQLFYRGIMCNILVCLAVWAYYKLKDETAKLIMIFWCLYAFISSGFEHCVANMTLLTIALMIPHKANISVGAYVHNLTAVTLGNIVGGAIFVGLAYWYISKEKDESKESNKSAA